MPIQEPNSEYLHRRRIEFYALEVQRLYSLLINDLVFIASKINNVDISKLFSFKNYPQKRVVKKIIEKYSVDLTAIIVRGTTSEWHESAKKKDTKLSKINVYNSRNEEALFAFQKRVEGRLQLSDKVWNYSQQAQQEIEIALSEGIGTGKSASELTKDVRKNLKEPDRLFRRVRDKFGVLQLSQKAKAYNAGQGVYQSSFKNALRLTRTEINMAYRTSDFVRWQNDKSVIGFEVKLSNHHKVQDICDDLKGQYPKSFHFKGWHPNCLCFSVPILMNDADFDKLQQATIDGEDLPKSFKPTGEVDQVPQGLKKWIENNKERSKTWKSQPYFVRDNFKGASLSEGLKI